MLAIGKKKFVKTNVGAVAFVNLQSFAELPSKDRQKKTPPTFRYSSDSYVRTET